MSNTVYIIVGLAIVATFTLMVLLAQMYRKAGPNEALIIYGFRGHRIIRGHGSVILPLVEHARTLSLELMSFDVAPRQDLYTKHPHGSRAVPQQNAGRA